LFAAPAAFAVPPPADDTLTENAASQWSAAAQGATANVSDDASRVQVGSTSVRFATDGGFDTWLWALAIRDADWDLTFTTAIRFWVYAENPSPFDFQNNSPWIRLGTGPGTNDYFQWQTNQNILNLAVDNWYEMRIPLNGDLTWMRTQVGSPDLTNIDYVEIHADTWDFGFTLWFDGLTFEETPINPTGLAALAGDGAVALTWDSYTPRPGFSHFAIYRDTIPYTSVSGMTPIVTIANAATADYFDSTVVNGTAYYYAITAVDGVGSEDTDVESVGPRIPTVPGNLTITPFYSTAHLVWDPVVHGEVAGYDIYRASSPGVLPSAPIQRVLQRSDYSDYNLTPGQTYYYQIIAINGDGEGISVATDETSATLATDPSGFSVHKNMELLMAFYTGGMTTAQVDRMTAGLRKGLEFYWRTTRGQLNMDVTWLYINLDTPGTGTGWDNGLLQADLRSRGVLNDQYDLAYLVGQDLAGCLGGYVIFNSTCASLGTVCGVAYPENDPDVDYTIAWTYTHEIHHALETMENITGAGTPEVLFCHFPWAYPDPLGPTGWHMDWGAHFDGIAQTNREYGADWMLFPAPYDGYIECVDSDGDGLPDDDARVWMDEARFGSDPGMADTDSDGLDDLGEYSAYNFRGTDPLMSDSDGDGLADGMDHQPLYRVGRYIPFVSPAPVIDGDIEDAWPILETGYYFTKSTTDFELTTYAAYDRDNLYLAFDASRQLRYKISLDGSGEDGRFESPVRHVAGATDTNNQNNKQNHFGDSWGDGNHVYTYYGAGTVQVFGRSVIPGAAVVSAFDTVNGVSFRTEVRLPRVLPEGAAYTWYPSDAPVVDGLTLSPGQVIGLNVTASNLTGSDGTEFSGTWTSVFETHAYVDFTLQRAGDIDLDGDWDLVDFAHYQACAAVVTPVAAGCELFDFDANNQLDATDLGAFVDLLDGP
jgi:hypothetical protein